MKCENIGLNLESYIQGDLGRDEKMEVEKHLKSCPDCLTTLKELKSKINVLMNHKPVQARITHGFEDRLTAKFQSRYKAKPRFPKALVATVAIMLMLSSVYAQATTGFLTNLGNFFLGDSGIQHAIEIGAGQVVNKSVTNNGITTTIHSIIADGNRTVILFSVQGPNTDYAEVGSFQLTDRKGKAIDYTASYKYEEGVITGYIETVSSDRLANQIQISLDDIQFSQLHPETFVLDLDATYPKVLKGKNAEYTIEDIVVKNNELTIIAYTQPLFNLQQGEEVLSFIRSMTYADGRWERTYRLTDPDAEILANINFKEAVTKTSKKAKFSIGIDRDRIEHHTFVKEIQQRVELEPGLEVIIERLVASVSETVIEARVKAGAIGVDYLDVHVYSAGERVDSRWSLQGGPRENQYTIRFSPTVSLTDLELKIVGVRPVKDVKFAIDPEDIEASLDFGDLPLEIQEVSNEAGLVRLLFKSTDPNVEITYGGISQADGLKGSVLEFNSFRGEVYDEVYTEVIIEIDHRPWTLELGITQGYKPVNKTIIP